MSHAFNEDEINQVVAVREVLRESKVPPLVDFAYNTLPGDLSLTFWLEMGKYHTDPGFQVQIVQALAKRKATAPRTIVNRDH